MQCLDSTESHTPTPKTKYNTKILSVDPRSPTVEFIRTPIAVTEELTNKKLRNKNLDKARKEFVLSSPKNPLKNTAPKLLESSPITAKLDAANKRRSVVGLLETNIDYTETDLDAVLKVKEEKVVDIIETQNIDPRSPTNDFVRTPVQILKKVGEIDLNDKVYSNSVELVEEETQSVETIRDLLKTPVTAVKVINTTPTAHDNILKDLDNDSPIKEFDEKLTNLIYADIDSDVPLRKTKSKDIKRTPLATKNHNLDGCESGEIKKNTSKLKVSDRPSKNVKVVSKIPVFTEKKLRRKVLEQCENTPPTEMKTAVPRSVCPRWDSDKTLII